MMGSYKPEHITTRFFKNKPQGIAIVILLAIEGVINFFDIFDSLLLLLFYSVLAIFLIIADAVVFYMLYEMFVMPSKVAKTVSDERMIFVLSLKNIGKNCFIIAGAEIGWLLISLIIGLGPGVLYWVALLAPVISGIIAYTTAGDVESNQEAFNALKHESIAYPTNAPVQESGQQKQA